MTNSYFEFEAIWTHRYITIYDKISDELQKSVTQKVMDFLHDFEDNYSRFRENSLISQLSKNWYIKNPPIELLQMLYLAKKSEELSDGYFNILIANTLIKLWYGQNLSNVNTSKIPSLNSVASRNADEIILQNWRNLDLWWLGKGRAIDKISELIKGFWIKNFMVNGWWDIYINNSLTDETMVYFQDPQNMSLAIWHASINQWWFASSSPYHRNWSKNWQKYHHLIDPNTWNSSDSPLLWVYIYHKTKAVIADIASTIIYISEPEKIEKIAKSFEVEYLIILPNYQTIMSDNFPWILFTS